MSHAWPSSAPFYRPGDRWRFDLILQHAAHQSRANATILLSQGIGTGKPMQVKAKAQFDGQVRILQAPLSI